MNLIYTMLKYFNDLKAIKNGRIVKRIGWRIAGKVSGRLFGRIFK